MPAIIWCMSMKTSLIICVHTRSGNAQLCFDQYDITSIYNVACNLNAQTTFLHRLPSCLLQRLQVRLVASRFIVILLWRVKGTTEIMSLSIVKLIRKLCFCAWLDASVSHRNHRFLFIALCVISLKYPSLCEQQVLFVVAAHLFAIVNMTFWDTAS